jgi:uncharacterized protein (TIGR03083 family)
MQSTLRRLFPFARFSFINGENMNRDEILRTIKEQYAELVQAIESVPVERLTKPPLVDWWTIKDLLGHVTMWNQVAVKFIREYKETGTPQQLGIKDDADLDRYNKRGVAMRRDLAFAQVRAEFDATYRELLAAVETLRDEDLSKPLPPPWGEGATLERLIAVNSYQHVPEHVEQITAFEARL